jgi:hypothetical protein
MIKKILSALTLIGSFGLSANAQSVVPCGTDDIYHQLLLSHPEIADRNAALNQEIAEKLSKLTLKDLAPFAKTTDDGSTMYNVPLVFHVIHNYGSEYVTDQQIINSVALLNDFYLKRNADTALVIAPYKGFINNTTDRYIGKANITWQLATIGPDGKTTSGITRRRSYLTASANDLAKYDQWPSNNYMNIWVINTIKPTPGGVGLTLAYAYKPASGDVIPYYDGVITRADAINNGGTLAHELGHELNLDHPWGSTNAPMVACGDDEVDDTPPTDGHFSCTAADLYDTTCIFQRNKPVAKLRLDSIKYKSDTATDISITFKNRTTSTIESFGFYPSAPIGSTYKIGLRSPSNVIIDSATVVTTVKDTFQIVTKKFRVPPAFSTQNYSLFFMKNPGAYRDTITASTSIYPKGFNGTIQLANVATDNFYNYFYNWKITYGYYKIYPIDELIDYPDTANSQNIMDYSGAACDIMFTKGQVDRMRAALTSTVANRSNLITTDNQGKTGIFIPRTDQKPKAEFSVERGTTAAGIPVSGAEPSYFLCADNPDASFSFNLRDRSWGGTATTKEWSLSNGAISATPTSGSIRTKFTTPGWAKIMVVAGNANGTDSFETMPGIYIADPVAINPIGYYQDFKNDAENAKWPIFNYFNNQYKWELHKGGSGVYDGFSMKYTSYDNRRFPDNLLGDASGDYDDFFSPAFDLSGLGDNGNINFMYAGAYATNNPALMKDVFEVAYSTTCGGNWTTLRTIKDAEIQTVGSIPTSLGEFRPDWNEWKAVSIDLKAGTANIRNNKVFFRFRYKPSSRTLPGLQGAYASGNNFFIDRINISNNPLSVNEMVLGNKQVAIAPNPATDKAFVLFQKANANVKIDVLDMTGKLVYSIQTSITTNNAQVEIPVGQLGAKGIYMVRISGDNNINQTEKLVVY